MPSHLPSHAFFLDAIKEIYDKDTSPSIYSKKYPRTSMRGLQIAMPCTVGAFSIGAGVVLFRQ
jgi:hypothetical protein